MPFPIHVGVTRIHGAARHSEQSIPHARGGDPKSGIL